MIDAFYTIFIRIPLIILAIIATIIFILSTIILFGVGFIAHVLLCAAGLSEAEAFSDSEW